mmetsp:Transcript_19270/g.30562  ORF Transcript_19270/g.30562 Transcript_19270/m.30562 type:complete len:261 (-) Transcript_19270:1022-1804(-)
MAETDKKAEEDTKATDVATKKEEVSGGDNEPQTEETEPAKKAESIYDAELPNRIIVGRTHPLSFYVDRARRVFRIEEEVFVQGRGDNIATTCKLVESLRRQKIATIGKISTGMNVEPYFTGRGDARWGQPTSIVLFQLKRGELGEYIADYQQRKVIEIFENADEKQDGTLSLEQIDALKLPSAFQANEEQCNAGKQFLTKHAAQNKLDLPNFIKYASILIHPLLKARVFKEALVNEFDLDVSGVPKHKDEDDEDLHDDEH